MPVASQHPTFFCHDVVSGCLLNPQLLRAPIFHFAVGNGLRLLQAGQVMLLQSCHHKALALSDKLLSDCGLCCGRKAPVEVVSQWMEGLSVNACSSTNSCAGDFSPSTGVYLYSNMLR